STTSTHAPIGRPASNHELAATTTARPRRTSAIPSRRCPGSMSRARPIDRAAPPVPRTAISQLARTARPPGRPPATCNVCLRGLPALLSCRRSAAGRALRDLPREVALDLLVRVPERAAVLLAMRPSLVAIAPYSPSATRVTKTSQFGHGRVLAWRNG